MTTLSEYQINEVSHKLDGMLKCEQLKVDLHDHICTMIEERMERGASYEAAYYESFSTFTQDHMDDLGFATEFLTKHYYNMDKKTIITGVIGMSVCLLALLGKQLHLMGSNMTLIVGAMIVIFGFFMRATLQSSLGMPGLKFKISAWIGFFGVSATLAGIVLVILNWYQLAAGFLILGGALLAYTFMFFSFNRLDYQK